MKNFMAEDFLLHSATAKELYLHIKNLPIIDYHCHLDPYAIAQNSTFKNITDLWLGGDHYKWRLMRHNGIPESHITGNAPDDEIFAAFCATVEKAIGNPVFHWAHMEMREYFGYDKPITAACAADLYALCNKQIQAKDFNVHSLLQRSNVEWLATTDDPIDKLEDHIRISEMPDIPKVFPSFRPSSALDIDKPTFVDYIKKLGATDWESLTAILAARVGHFNRVGCKSSDHSLEPPVFNRNKTKAHEALDCALHGITPTPEQAAAYKTELLIFLSGEYAKHNWVMQLHMGAQRNNNSRMLKIAGPDTGFDIMSDGGYSLALNQLLNAMEEQDTLPRTVLYSLNPNSDDMLSATTGNFAGRGIKGRIQWGSAWWFNDTKIGMEKHMTTLASHGLLANFIGMLTDSRSFISYPRHDYFRRILANQLGAWVEAGEFPHDMELLCEIAEGIAYKNVKEYFT